MVKIEEVRRAIIHCMVQRLTIKDSLDYINNKQGLQLAESTFYKYKRKIKSERFKRMREIADTGYIDYHLDAIDTLEWAKKEMISNYENEQEPYKRVEILTQIINMLPYFAEYISESKKVMELKAIAESSTSKEEIKTAVPS